MLSIRRLLHAAKTAAEEKARAGFSGLKATLKQAYSSASSMSIHPRNIPYNLKKILLFLVTFSELPLAVADRCFRTPDSTPPTECSVSTNYFANDTKICRWEGDHPKTFNMISCRSEILETTIMNKLTAQCGVFNTYESLQLHVIGADCPNPFLFPHIEGYGLGGYFGWDYACTWITRAYTSLNVCVDTVFKTSVTDNRSYGTFADIMTTTALVAAIGFMGFIYAKDIYHLRGIPNVEEEERPLLGAAN
jgi:hypothetical protein